MDVTVYLPDEVGQRAKEAGLNLSRMLRDAVTDELERRTTMASTLEDVQTYELNIEDEDGRIYTGRVAGKEIAYDEVRGGGVVRVYVTDDERVIVYDQDKLHYYDLSADPSIDLGEALRGWLSPAAYTVAMHSLGEKPVIDL